MNQLNPHDINAQVYSLLEDLSSFGMKSSPRGQHVVEANIATLDIDPTYPIMNFPARKFNYKYFAGELAWYLQAVNTTNLISKFSGFWENLKNEDTDTINSNYGYILLNDHPSTIYSKDSDRYSKNPVNGLSWAYDSLLKDKDSRQAVAFLNCPFYQFEGNKDFVCTMYLNFWIRHDRLDMKVQMRSNDIFFGLSYDAPWFSLIHQSMYLNLKKEYPELKLGMYYHCADNIHYYERHFETVEKILENDLIPSPKVELKHPLFYFTSGKLFVTPEAREFQFNIEALSESENFSLMKQIEWKNTLSSLITFEEEKTAVI